MIWPARARPPSGERGRGSESRCEAFCLLDGGGLYYNPEVPVDCPLLRVDGLENTAEKHCCGNDILAGPGELWDIVPLIHDVVLDLTSATLGATRWAMRMGRNVARRACRRRRRLALPPLS